MNIIIMSHHESYYVGRHGQADLQIKYGQVAPKVVRWMGMRTTIP